MIFEIASQDVVNVPDPKQVSFDGDKAIVRTGDDITIQFEVVVATRAQIRIALRRLGIQLNRNLLQEVINAVYGSDNEELKIWWEDQLEYHSDNAKVVAMGQLLNINIQQLFEIAQTIKP